MQKALYSQALQAWQRQQQSMMLAAGGSCAGALRHLSSLVPKPPDNVQEVETPLPPANVGPWKRVKDERSAGHYWWNPQTNATTPVGAPKPDAWVRVVSEGGGYFWNKHDGITTSVGEPLPGPEGRVQAPYSQQQPDGRSAMFNMITYPMMVGVGFGLFAGLLRLIF